MIEGKTMAEVEAKDRGEDITPEQALAYRDALLQLGRLDARGVTLRRPDEWVEIPSRHTGLPRLASHIYVRGYVEERKRKQRNEQRKQRDQGDAA